jgi:hypothetical protein
MIGIVSHDGDLHASTVRSHLDTIGAPNTVIDTAHLPNQTALTAWTDPASGWTAEWGLHGIDVAELAVMWWRRPQPFQIAPDVSGLDDRGFIVGECGAAVAGLWSCLDAVWINDPDRDEAASRKMWQLKVANELGLRVPRTCMTSSPERARQFLASEHGTVVYKSFSATPSTWRETRPVGPAEIDLLDSVRLAPVIFQEAIPGGRDVRVTVVGEQMFAAEITVPDHGYEYDFRLHSADATYTPVELPDDVRRRLAGLMQRFGLWYGAADFRRDADGELVFLEVNPAGQWLFVEYATGQPISRALADLLADLDRRAARAA